MHFGKKLKIDKGVLVPEVTTHKGVSEREAFLLSMEIGDSFMVEPHPEDPSNNVSQNYTATGKRLGMKMTSRKIYSKDDPKSYHFRIWYIEKIEPKTKTQQRNKKVYKSQRRADLITENHEFKDAEVRQDSFNDLASGRLPSDILFLAEQNEENKAIVEDIRRLNKILLEELSKQNIKLPKEE